MIFCILQFTYSAYLLPYSAYLNNLIAYSAYFLTSTYSAYFVSYTAYFFPYSAYSFPYSAYFYPYSAYSSFAYWFFLFLPGFSLPQSGKESSTQATSSCEADSRCWGGEYMCTYSWYIICIWYDILGVCQYLTNATGKLTIWNTDLGFTWEILIPTCGEDTEKIDFHHVFLLMYMTDIWQQTYGWFSHMS
jgi:hypothetical protein